MPVTLLEAQEDFGRDFRGDMIEETGTVAADYGHCYVYDACEGRQPAHAQYTLPSRPNRCHFRLRACKTREGGPEERAREP